MAKQVFSSHDIDPSPYNMAVIVCGEIRIDVQTCRATTACHQARCQEGIARGWENQQPLSAKLTLLQQLWQSESGLTCQDSVIIDQEYAEYPKYLLIKASSLSRR